MFRMRITTPRPLEQWSESREDNSPTKQAKCRSHSQLPALPHLLQGLVEGRQVLPFTCGRRYQLHLLGRHLVASPHGVAALGAGAFSGPGNSKRQGRETWSLRSRMETRASPDLGNVVERRTPGSLLEAKNRVFRKPCPVSNSQ